MKNKNKITYESPVIIPLGELARGSGNCSPGSYVTTGGGNCSDGGFAAGSGGNCNAGSQPANNCVAGGNGQPQPYTP